MSFTGRCALGYLPVSFYYDEGHQEPTMSRMCPSKFSRIHEGCVIQNQFLSFCKHQLPRFGVYFVGPIMENVRYSIQILASLSWGPLVLTIPNIKPSLAFGL